MFPISYDTAQNEAILNYKVTNWCLANANLIGQFSSSQGAFTLSDTVNDPKPTILSPNAAVVLNEKFEV
ncbi:12767_t:CDS:2 [Gigaspora margarita]|uniref:12767_t:CDS:1 n=1 Tax=Gigaspora margarita TaxID=4874 RepID=A0ABN7VX03_GIGMA|nr:12767_t:CDS:2 [Gigaspora margarita]